MVVTGFALSTEAANPHTNPLIQISERMIDLCHAEIVGKTSKDRIQVIKDSLDIPPLLP